MDPQKFLFAQSSSNPSELRLHIANTLMDIKDIIGSVHYFSSEVTLSLSLFAQDASKHKIDENMKHIAAACSAYDLCCQQLKLLRERLKTVISALPISKT